MFGDYLDPLGDEFHLVLVDQRSQGRSDRTPPATWTLERMAADVERARRGDGLRPLRHARALLRRLRRAPAGGRAAPEHATRPRSSRAARRRRATSPSDRGRTSPPFEPARAARAGVSSRGPARATSKPRGRKCDALLHDQLPFHFADPRDPRIDEFERRAAGVVPAPDLLRHFAVAEYGGIEVEERLGDLAAVEAGLPVFEYTPAEIKRSVVGYGRADKPQVQQMIKLLLGPRGRFRRRTMPLTRSPSPSATCTRTRRRVASAPSSRRAARPPDWRQYRPASAPAALRRRQAPNGRDRASPRFDSRKITLIGSWSTSTAWVTKCSCRCRRSMCSATQATQNHRCGSTATCARTRSLLYGFARPRTGLVRAVDRGRRYRAKGCLAVLSGIEPQDSDSGDRTWRPARLTAIPGVGKKTSERIVIELKDRLPRAPVAASAAGSAASAPPRSATMWSRRSSTWGIIDLSPRKPSRSRNARSSDRGPEAGFERMLKQAF